MGVQNRITSLLTSCLNRLLRRVVVAQRQQLSGDSSLTPSTTQVSDSPALATSSRTSGDLTQDSSESTSGDHHPSSIEFVISLSATPQNEHATREEVWQDIQGMVGTLLQTLSGRGHTRQASGQARPSESTASSAPTTSSAQQSGQSSTRPLDPFVQVGSSQSSHQSSSDSQSPSSHPPVTPQQSNSTQSQDLDSLLETTLNSTLNPSSEKRDTPANLPNPKRSK